MTKPIADAMRAGRFNPHVVNEDLFFRKQLRQPVDPDPYLTALLEFLERQEIDLFVAYLPSRGQVSDHYGAYQSEYSISRKVASIQGAEFQIHAAALARSCGRLGLPFLDLTPALLVAERAGEHLFWNYDGHLNGPGYTLVAQVLHDWWLAGD